MMTNPFPFLQRKLAQPGQTLTEAGLILAAVAVVGAGAFSAYENAFTAHANGVGEGVNNAENEIFTGADVVIETAGVMGCSTSGSDKADGKGDICSCFSLVD